MVKAITTSLILFIFGFLQAQTVQFDTKVFLEGPFFNDHMTTDLNQGGHLPLDQPFNISPWNYAGDESVSSIPSTDVVDWILLEIVRQTADSVTPVFELFDRQAAFLLSNGNIRGLDGSEIPSFNLQNISSFHIQVKHRNHLPVISSETPKQYNGIYEWDFTTGPDKAIGLTSSQKQLSQGVWSMIAADGNASSQVDNRDKNSIWLAEFGNTGYFRGDFDMNGQVDLTDIGAKWSLNAGQGSSRTRGILKVCDQNGRYFCSGGEAVYLTGSHTWDNFQDIGGVEFDYDDYLDWMKSMNQNFIRLWAWETPQGTDWANNSNYTINPLPYLKSGSQYDVSSLNPEYFERLRQRVQAAEERGIYVAIMFFEGFSAEHTPIAWNHHPFKSGNNLNGVSVARYDVHTNINPAVVEAQRLYVREVIDIVNVHNLNNVLYEIGNEIPYTPESDQWQNDMIDFIHNYEMETYGVNRPVGKTYQNDGGNNTVLFNSPADWISPNTEGGYDCAPGDAPVANGDKVIISDTDHFYYIWYNNIDGWPVDFVWKSFTGGINAIHMDNWGGGSNIAGRLHGPANSDIFNLIRYNMGWATEMAKKVDLVSMTPQPGLSSTGFCLASDKEFIVYLPDGIQSVNVNLTGVSGQFAVEWFNTGYGTTTSGSNVSGGYYTNLTSPYGDYSVLYLKKIE